MPLTAGDKLGPYEIISLIGKGGMGEAYHAHDPRTGRDVAVKVSAQQFSERFDREVRAVASLNHPNICSLYDVGPNYLLMEFIEGEAPQGPLPLDTAMNYARQIAAALVGSSSPDGFGTSCSSFTRVTACQITRPPGGLLSRGSSPALPG
jgi:eukaryotic-like serine/threonine-protein kinase